MAGVKILSVFLKQHLEIDLMFSVSNTESFRFIPRVAASLRSWTLYQPYKLHAEELTW
jgi:hypothetical protein